MLCKVRSIYVALAIIPNALLKNSFYLFFVLSADESRQILPAWTKAWNLTISEASAKLKQLMFGDGPVPLHMILDALSQFGSDYGRAKINSSWV